MRWWHDYTVFEERFRFFHSATFFSARIAGEPFEYPAPAALVYQFFYSIPGGVTSFLGVTFAGVLGLACWLILAMDRRGCKVWVVIAFVAMSLAFSYPFWFEFSTANIEICIFLLFTAGTIALLRDRPYLAAVLFGIVGAIKIFPLLFLGLLLSQRRYKALTTGIATAIGLNVVALWAICPDIGLSSRGINAGLAVNQAVYILPFRPLNTPTDHSLIGLAKRVLHEFHVEQLSVTELATYLAMTAVAGLVIYLVCIRTLPMLNQILLLTIAAVLLPPTSHDYTLIHLYVPWALCTLYLIGDVSGRNRRGMCAALVCFAVVFSPEYELMYRGEGFSAQVKCVALIVLFITTLMNPWRSELDERPFTLVAVDGSDEQVPYATIRARDSVSDRSKSR